MIVINNTMTTESVQILNLIVVESQNLQRIQTFQWLQVFDLVVRQTENFQCRQIPKRIHVDRRSKH